MLKIYIFNLFYIFVLIKKLKNIPNDQLSKVYYFVNILYQINLKLRLTRNSKGDR